MQYYLHDGFLWKGPVSPEDTLHWAKFYGFMIVEPFDEIWVAERTYAHPGVEFISEHKANWIILDSFLKHIVPPDDSLGIL